MRRGRRRSGPEPSTSGEIVFILSKEPQKTEDFFANLPGGDYIIKVLFGVGSRRRSARQVAESAFSRGVTR
jgi:hypothetical protein